MHAIPTTNAKINSANTINFMGCCGSWTILYANKNLMSRIYNVMYTITGQDDQKESEDAPLMIKEDGATNQQNDGIELSPSSSPQPG